MPIEKTKGLEDMLAGCVDQSGEDLRARVAALEGTLAQERARGAVWRLAALNLYTDLDMLYHGGRWPPEIKTSAVAVLSAETSPAVAALLELAEAAEAMEESGITDQMTPDRDVLRFRAAVKRLKEAPNGMG